MFEPIFRPGKSQRLQLRSSRRKPHHKLHRIATWHAFKRDPGRQLIGLVERVRQLAKPACAFRATQVLGYFAHIHLGTVRQTYAGEP